MFTYLQSPPQNLKITDSDAKSQQQNALTFLPFSASLAMNLLNSRNGKNKTRGKRRALRTGITWSVTAGAMPKTSLPSTLSTKMYDVIQNFSSTSFLTTSTTVPVFGSIYFTLNDLGQSTQWAALFDQYRVNLLEIWIEPQPSVTGIVNSKWCSVEDFDDAAVLTTYTQAMDYANAVESYIGDGHLRRFQPYVAFATYSGAFTSYGSIASPWIDCTSTTVQHYGVKVAVQPAAGAYAIQYTIRAHLSFKNVR